MYLQGTKAKGLIFRRGDGTLTLKAFYDADFGGEPEGNDQPMRSTTGLLVYLHGVGPLYWKSQLQTVTATSTEESEYCSAGACARVLVGFRQLCHSLGFTQDSIGFTTSSILCQDKALSFQESTYQDPIPLCERAYPR